MKRFFVGAIAATGLFASFAYAADLPARRAEAITPAQVVAYNWSGFYTATTVGGGWQHIHGSDAAGGIDRTSGSRGWTGSAIGIQGMWGNWVLGLEGSYSTPFSHKYDSSTGANCTVVAGATCNSRINSIWTVGGKAGYAFGNWMVYG